MLKLLSVALLLLQSVSGGDLEDRIARVEARWKLAERMAELHVPGVSIAVVSGGKVEWARAYGVAETGVTAKVNPETRFQAASISIPLPRWPRFIWRSTATLLWMKT